MTLWFESNFTEDSTQIDPQAEPNIKGSGELSIVSDPYYSWPYSGYALVKADPNAPHFASQGAAFNTYIGSPAKTDIWSRAYFLRTTELPLDTDHMMPGQDEANGENDWNWATLINLKGACSIRLRQIEGKDPPEYDWILLLAFNDAGTTKFLNSSFAWDNWSIGIWKSIEIHWIRDTINGGAEVFFNGIKVHEVWGYDTANLPGRDPGDYGGVRYVQFGALTATQRYKDFGVIVDNIKIADAFIGTEPPTPPPPIQFSLTYMSEPITVNATINGQSVPSGSSINFDEGSIVTITVPKQIETQIKYIFSHFIVNGEVIQTNNAEITIEMNSDIELRTIYIISPKFILTYMSEPIGVNATINGQSVPSGSSINFDEGSIVTITVPKEVEI